MATARTRRRFATALVAGLWLGAALFALAALRPALARALAMQQELDEALTVMKGRLERELVPSEGVIGHYEALKKAMIREAESCAYEYLRHSECLGKDLLQSWRMDPYEVEMNFRAVKKRLADKAGHPDFLDLGPLGVWDQEASPGSRRPTQQDLAALEKRTCIASVLVDILAHEPGTVIDLMKITDPLQPRKAPPAPQVPWLVVRHHIYPVQVKLTTPFAGLGRLLSALANVPPDSTEVPCMAITRLQVESIPPRGQGKVQVELAVHVYDFYRVKDQSR